MTFLATVAGTFIGLALFVGFVLLVVWVDGRYR